MSKPDFLIIGAAKSGTTTLLSELKKHPDIFMKNNEVHYFTHEYEKGADWYALQFGFPDKVQGEKSTSYLYEKSCYQRIFKYKPEMKLIVLLREPVKRAFSNWNMRHIQGRLLKQTVAFNSFSGLSIENIGFSHLFDYYTSCNFEKNRHLQPLDIFERSLYIDQIQHLLAYFKPEQLLILISEHYFKNPESELKKVSQFLNIGEFEKDEHPWKRKSQYPVKLDEKVDKELYEFYKPYNERLYDFLGFEIPEWKRK